MKPKSKYYVVVLLAGILLASLKANKNNPSIEKLEKVVILSNVKSQDISVNADLFKDIIKVRGFTKSKKIDKALITLHRRILKVGGFELSLKRIELFKGDKKIVGKQLREIEVRFPKVIELKNSGTYKIVIDNNNIELLVSADGKYSL